MFNENVFGVALRRHSEVVMIVGVVREGRKLFIVLGLFGYVLKIGKLI